MKLTTFIKAERTSMNHVEAEYKLNATGESFIVTWCNLSETQFNIVEDYDLDVLVRSNNPDLADRVSNAIREGESDDNSDCELYLEIRDTFDAQNAEDFAALDLEYEYNEYVVGYVVTDKNTAREINFQFEKYHQSNHPTPDFYLYSQCEGDETYKEFKQYEIDYIAEWLDSKSDVKEAEETYTKAHYVDDGKSILDIASSGHGVALYDLKEIAEQAV